MPRARDPMARKAEADRVVDDAVFRLQELLKEAVAGVDPFPSFPGAFFTFGVEVDVGPGAPPNLGCVIVQPDGELYELKMGVDLDNIDVGDPVAMRKEEVKKLDELHPLDRLIYLSTAISVVTELLLDQHAPSND
ncbi:MAG: hypothetical protein WEB00_03535 [Dehalococcoidia bacterium]